MEICMNLFVYPILDYGDVLYDNCKQLDKDELRSVQLAAARAITGAKYRTSHDPLYKELGWKPLQERRDVHKITKLYDIVNSHTPNYLQSNLPPRFSGRATRGATAGNLIIVSM